MRRCGYPLALRRMPLASLTGATSGISVRAGTGTTGLPAIYFGGGALGSNSMPSDGGVSGIMRGTASNLEGHRTESEQIRQIGRRVRLVSLEVEHSSLPTLTDVIAVPSVLAHLIEQLVHP